MTPTELMWIVVGTFWVLFIIPASVALCAKHGRKGWLEAEQEYSDKLMQFSKKEKKNGNA